jgi:cardiolipin synthase
LKSLNSSTVGEDYFQRLTDLISNAQTEIHLQTYIFKNDSTGTMIVNALKEAAARNVKIYLFLDTYGSSLLSWAFVKELESQGIKVRFFSLFFSKNIFHLGRRLHHKVAVADDKIALIGGINVADNACAYARTQEQRMKSKLYG